MRRAGVATLARTLARLQPRQIVMRPYARVAPSIARVFSRARPVRGDAMARIRAWAASVASSEERAAVAEASRLIEERCVYAGQRLPLGSAPISFPSRLAEYEFQYRRWLVGLAMLARRREIALADVLRWWRDPRFAAARSLYEPYVLARRSFSEALASGLVGEQLDEESRVWVLDRLAKNAAAMRLVTEGHLAANHELTHAAAIAVMSLLLDGDGGALDRYRALLQSQVDRDGVHEERSPAYQLIALADLRRVIAAAHTCGFPAPPLEELDRSLSKSLAAFVRPDGTLPMFHDSAAIVVPAPSDYGIVPIADGLSDFPESGFISWRQTGVHLVADFGEPRPAHQPGHQHAAPFAFDVWWRRPFITSAGLTTYAADERRLFERGVAAHASVRVDGREPAEIWSAFRMGRGFRVIDRTVSGTPSAFTVSAAHDGFAPRLHRRTIEASGTTINVLDSIEGAGDAEVEVFFPIGPEWTVRRDSLTQVSCEAAGDVATIDVSGAELTIDPFKIALAFGDARDAYRVTAHVRVRLPHQIVTTIVLAGHT